MRPLFFTLLAALALWPREARAQSRLDVRVQGPRNCASVRHVTRHRVTPRAGGVRIAITCLARPWGLRVGPRGWGELRGNQVTVNVDLERSGGGGGGTAWYDLVIDVHGLPRGRYVVSAPDVGVLDARVNVPGGR